MNKFVILILGILFLMNFSCQETKKKTFVAQKKQLKKTEIIKRTEKLKPIEDIRNVLKDNSEFLKFYESLKSDSYSIDELIDLTKNDLMMFKKIRIKRFASKIDTAPVKSRLTLTEINLKKLNFLLHKKKIEEDTIRKTLDEITRNINATIDKIRLYNQSTDEFENILAIDSLVHAKKDSMTSDKKEVFKNLNKIEAQKINKNIDFKLKRN